MSLFRLKYSHDPIARLVAVRVPLVAVLAAALVLNVSLAFSPVCAQTAERLAVKHGRAAMEQALQTKQFYDVYGIHFAVDQATSSLTQTRSSTTLRLR